MDTVPERGLVASASAEQVPSRTAEGARAREQKKEQRGAPATAGGTQSPRSGSGVDAFPQQGLQLLAQRIDADFFAKITRKGK